MVEKPFLQLQPQQVIEGPLLRNGIVLYPRPEYTTGLLATARNMVLHSRATCRPTRWGTHAGVFACLHANISNQSNEHGSLHTRRRRRGAREGERGRLSDSVPLVVRSGECAYGNLKYDIRLRTHGRGDARRSERREEAQRFGLGLIDWHKLAK